ncbi:MAG: multidrug ABC transporter permease [Gammaproteobacteria bacterium]
MKRLVRPALTLAASFFAYMLIAIFLPLFTDVRYSTATWVSVPVALFAGWYTWYSQQGEKKGVITAVVSGAVVVGSIAFAAGFFGPMIFAPGANQGPLLGIFITGPLGLIVGAVGGLIYWLRANQTSGNTGRHKTDRDQS